MPVAAFIVESAQMLKISAFFFKQNRHNTHLKKKKERKKSSYFIMSPLSSQMEIQEICSHSSCW